ncbi:hypothetical protein, partial [Ferrovibrio sp.]|uniref:hypothetical protein n=1 Tax=Ferrovibrio sp. TaxID=1917215 RepID=UPI00260BB81B
PVTNATFAVVISGFLQPVVHGPTCPGLYLAVYHTRPPAAEKHRENAWPAEPYGSQILLAVLRRVSVGFRRFAMVLMC